MIKKGLGCFKQYFIWIGLLSSIFLNTACQTSPNSITRMYPEQIAQLTDRQIIELSQNACQRADKQAVTPISSNHHLNRRLTELISTLPDELNEYSVNYKVYLHADPIAWSLGNGCVRIHSGLFAQLDHDELRAVIVHEFAHIALKHTIQKFRQAQYIEIIDDELTIILKNHTLQQFEIEADNYAITILKQNQMDLTSFLSMLKK